jgi:hypothetical protein
VAHGSGRSHEELQRHVGGHGKRGPMIGERGRSQFEDRAVGRVCQGTT